MSKNKKKGFTLTEILVVVLILAVLTAVAYPLYTRSINKSRAMEAVNLLEIVRAKQIEHYARTRDYYDDFSKMGQLTGNAAAETKSGATAKVKDYVLSLKEGQGCLTATYQKKGKNIFSFSSSYEQAGLGCTDETGGNFCASFGDVVGTAESVCNCNNVTCGSGYSVNPSTCQCECLLGCAQGGSCYAPYGGGQSRSCSSMGGPNSCGTQMSIDSCNGPVWTGACSAPTQTQAISQTCGGGNGTQTRTCTASCAGGSCGSWGGCVCNSGYVWNGSTCVSATCAGLAKPAETQDCGSKCGTQSRTVTCTNGAWVTGSWGSCQNEGACAKGSANCSATCQCNSGYLWNGSACVSATCAGLAKPAETQDCGSKCGTQSRTVTCTNGAWATGVWGACQNEGTCTKGSANCNTSCQCNSGYVASGGACTAATCDTGTKPAESQDCGSKCGKQTRTVTCNLGTWVTDTWGACQNEGTCTKGSANCSASCQCNSGFVWNGSSCVSATCAGLPKPAETESCDTQCNTKTRTVTCESGAWKTGEWSQCSGGGVCIKGTTQACGGGNGTQKCNSSNCSWEACVCNSGYKWNGSTCVVDKCEIRSSLQYGEILYSEVTSKDTCNRALTSFSCTPADKGKKCVDYISTGSCANKITKKNKWTLLSNDAYFSQKPSSNCTYSVIQMISPSGYGLGDFNESLANQACEKQCVGLGIGGTGTNATCKSSCRIVGNCWSAGPSGGYKCQIRDLSCDILNENKCTVGWANVECC